MIIYVVNKLEQVQHLEDENLISHFKADYRKIDILKKFIFYANP